METRTTCQLHGTNLVYAERMRPWKTTPKPQFPSEYTEDAFLEASFTTFPNARPSDPWITHYHYCPTCNAAQHDWREARRKKVQPSKPAARPS
jgi:hypothetical protein